MEIAPGRFRVNRFDFGNLFIELRFQRYTISIGFSVHVQSATFQQAGFGFITSGIMKTGNDTTAVVDGILQIFAIGFFCRDIEIRVQENLVSTVFPHIHF